MKKKMGLYLAHCGFYDPTIGEGIFESHINLFVTGESFEEARKKVKDHPEFKKRGLHIDGFQKLEQIQGYTVQLILNDSDSTETIIVPFSPSDMARAMPHS